MALQFNDTSNELGFCQEIDTICKTNTTTYPLKQKARRMNNALDIYFQKTMVWCGNWSVGDLNNSSDLPFATTNLVSGQQDYAISSAMLVIESVWIKGTDGIFKQLDFTEKNISTVDTGVPCKYFKTEYSIIFDVIPNYSSTAGIKIFYRRVLPRFASTDTTKTAGTPGLHDFYLARLASLPYLIENGNPIKNDVASQIKDDEVMCKDFYNFRGRDQRARSGFRPSRESNK